MGPDELVRVQVRRVAAELLDVQPRTAREERAHVGSLVHPAAVPQHDDVPAEMPQQGTEEHGDLH